MLRFTLKLATTTLALALLCQCQSTKASTADTTIRLGTWNIEHLGSRTKFQSPRYPDSPPDRTPEQFKKVATFIRDMQVDVLALQEIADEKSLQRLRDHLGNHYGFTLGTTGRYDDTRISVGFLWNTKRVELVQCEEMRDFPRKIGDLSVFHRKPVNAVFRVKNADGSYGFDFRAITVHLKASRGKKNEAKRSAETKHLLDYVSKLAGKDGEDQDIVVLGDFNHTYDAPAHKVFTASQSVRYLMQPPGPSSPTIVWFDEPIDHIATTPGIREEVRQSSVKVHSGLVDFSLKGDALKASKANWRVNYSDHFPVTVDLEASTDRDPRATFAAAKHKLPVSK